jgi:hypothetical protein
MIIVKIIALRIIYQNYSVIVSVLICTYLCVSYCLVLIPYLKYNQVYTVFIAWMSEILVNNLEGTF